MSQQRNDGHGGGPNSHQMMGGRGPGGMGMGMAGGSGGGRGMMPPPPPQQQQGMGGGGPPPRGFPPQQGGMGRGPPPPPPPGGRDNMQQQVRARDGAEALFLLLGVECFGVGMFLLHCHRRAGGRASAAGDGFFFFCRSHAAAVSSTPYGNGPLYYISPVPFGFLLDRTCSFIVLKKCGWRTTPLLILFGMVCFFPSLLEAPPPRLLPTQHAAPPPSCRPRIRPRYLNRFAPPMNARSRTGSDPSSCRKTDLVLTLYVSGLRESWAGRVLGRAAVRMGGWGSGSWKTTREPGRDGGTAAREQKCVSGHRRAGVGSG